MNEEIILASQWELFELKLIIITMIERIDPFELVSDSEIENAEYYHDLGNFSWEVWNRLIDVPDFRTPETYWKNGGKYIFSKAHDRGKDVENWLISKGEPLFLIPYYRRKSEG